jgi:hypothetical protein
MTDTAPTALPALSLTDADLSATTRGERDKSYDPIVAQLVKLKGKGAATVAVPPGPDRVAVLSTWRRAVRAVTDGAFVHRIRTKGDNVFLGIVPAPASTDETPETD